MRRIDSLTLRDIVAAETVAVVDNDATWDFAVFMPAVKPAVTALILTIISLATIKFSHHSFK
jgi:hypothetical protein